MFLAQLIPLQTNSGKKPGLSLFRDFELSFIPVHSTQVSCFKEQKSTKLVQIKGGWGNGINSEIFREHPQWAKF